MKVVHGLAGLLAHIGIEVIDGVDQSLANFQLNAVVVEAKQRLVMLDRLPVVLLGHDCLSFRLVLLPPMGEKIIPFTLVGDVGASMAVDLGPTKI